MREGECEEEGGEGERREREYGTGKTVCVFIWCRVPRLRAL